MPGSSEGGSSGLKSSLNGGFEVKANRIRPGSKMILFSNIGGQEYVVEFLKRDPRQSGRPARNYVRGDAFAGLNGPDDDGTVVLSDQEIAKNCRLHQENGGK